MATLLQVTMRHRIIYLVGSEREEAIRSHAVGTLFGGQGFGKIVKICRYYLDTTLQVFV